MPVARTQPRFLGSDCRNSTSSTPNPMTSASDGTLEERRYFCQNWRADVVAVTKSDGTPIEYVRYSAYGEPTVYPVADLNMDGVVNSTDSGLWSDLLYSTSNASVYADSDLDFDGLDDWNSGGADGDLFYESYNANLGLGGTGRVSSPGVSNRTGYAGYQWDQTLGAYHVRYRVYLPDIGRWTRRDPLGYVDGMGLYEYVQSLAVLQTDPLGLAGSGSGGAAALTPQGLRELVQTLLLTKTPAEVARILASMGLSVGTLIALGIDPEIARAAVAAFKGLISRTADAAWDLAWDAINKALREAGRLAACNAARTLKATHCKNKDGGGATACKGLPAQTAADCTSRVDRRRPGTSPVGVEGSQVGGAVGELRPADSGCVLRLVRQDGARRIEPAAGGPQARRSPRPAARASPADR
jgi:RHS repeat-associated protein